MWRKQPSSYWVWFPTEYLTLYCVGNQLWPTLASSGKAAPNPRSPSQAGAWIGQCCFSALPVLACCRDTHYCILEPILLPQGLVSLHPWSYAPSQGMVSELQACRTVLCKLDFPQTVPKSELKKGQKWNFMMQTRILEWQPPAWTHPWRQDCVLF